MIGPRSTIPRSRAFTMVEVIVVMLLIGILGALVVPRLGNLAERAAASEAESLAGLLTLAAQRAATSAQPGALEYAPASRTFSLLTQAAAPGLASAWQLAPLARPVRLERLTLRRAAVPGGLLPGSTAWRAPIGGGIIPPTISMLLADDQTVWQVELPEGASSARVIRLPAEGAWMPSTAVVRDLDAAGQRDKPW